jgi:primosomal protein N'
VQCNVHMIDIHRRDWSPIPAIQNRTLIAMEEARENERAIHIIHPIHGDRARLRCADCRWQAACERCGSGMHVKNGQLACLRCNAVADMNLSCPVCGSVDLSRAKAGRDKLRVDLDVNSFQEAAIHSLTEWNALPSMAANSLIILTDLALLGGGAEDLRKKERSITAFRRLVDTCRDSTLIIQGDAGLCTEAKQWLKPQGCYDALQRELDERRTFGLPPVTRLLKLIFRGNEGFASRQLETLRSRIGKDTDISIQGPFPVLHRPSRRQERWIGHVLMPLETPAERIYTAIEPLLQTDTILDLDPIAFFE